MPRGPGCWTALGRPGTRPRGKIRLIKGSHIVVPALHEGEQAYLLQNDDRRVVFVIPYEGRFSLIGTTDTPHEGDARDATRAGGSRLSLRRRRPPVPPAPRPEDVWCGASPACGRSMTTGRRRVGRHARLCAGDGQPGVGAPLLSVLAARSRPIGASPRRRRPARRARSGASGAPPGPRRPAARRRSARAGCRLRGRGRAPPCPGCRRGCCADGAHPWQRARPVLDGARAPEARRAAAGRGLGGDARRASSTWMRGARATNGSAHRREDVLWRRTQARPAHDLCFCKHLYTFKRLRLNG
jgi:hypothetical protein